MKLSFEQLKLAACGVTDVEECEGGIRFLRMNREQLQYYLDVRKDAERAKMARQNAGVRLAFLTDSRTVTFSAELLPDLSGPFCGFDVCENGVLIAHPGGENVAVQRLSATLSEGEKLLELYFPWCKDVILKELILDDGASFKPHRRSRRMLAFGDSITHGACAVHPSMSYIERLASLLDADVENRGVGGDVFSPGIVVNERVTNVDLVIAAYGTNDWGYRTLEHFQKAMPETVEALAARFPNTPVFVIAPLWRTDADTRQSMMGIPLHDEVELIRAAARPFENVTVIDAWNFIPHMQAFFSDHVHPNDLGFGLYTANLYREIVKVIK